MMSAAPDAPYEIGGIPAPRLARDFGTPLYVYDAAILRREFAVIRDSFTYIPTAVHYAIVANGSIALLGVLREAGAWAHANTPGDAFIALKAGFAPDRIMYTGSNLNEDDFRFVIKRGLRMNVDSLSQLEDYCRLAPGAEVGLRMHLEELLPDSRIGVNPAELPRARAIADRSSSRIAGLHYYVATNNLNAGLALAPLRELLRLGRAFPHMRYIDIGGGFGVDYTRDRMRSFPWKEFGAAASAALEEDAVAGRRLELYVEPGRSIVAGCGFLLTRVVSSKKRGERRFVGVDTTTGNLLSPSVHGVHREVRWGGATRAGARVETDLCGNTTHSRDYIARRALLPELRAGDLLTILDCGAYGYAMSSHFLNRPRPAEVLIDSGRARLITRREQLNDLIRNQVR